MIKHRSNNMNKKTRKIGSRQRRTDSQPEAAP